MRLLQRIVTADRKNREDERMALLAVEIGLAGGEILKEKFGFTDRQVAEWLDLMIDRAKVNRARVYAKMAIDDKTRER